MFVFTFFVISYTYGYSILDSERSYEYIDIIIMFILFIVSGSKNTSIFKFRGSFLQIEIKINWENLYAEQVFDKIESFILKTNNRIVFSVSKHGTVISQQSAFVLYTWSLF